MKILEISIQAFGTLENFKLDLSGGGQAFHALNESGKSTCLTFLRCAFYGMPRQQKNLIKNLRQRFLPFNHERSQGSVLFENDGRTYRLIRVFGEKPSGDVTQLLDERLGEQIPLQNPNAPGEEILGLEEGSFINTVFVGQMKVPYSGDEDRDDALVKRLTALGSSGDEDVSITTIRDSLKEAERQLTSTTRKNSLLPGLEAEAKQLKIALSEARAERDALAQGMEELEKKEFELRGLEAQLVEERAWTRLHQLARDEAGLRQQEVVEAQRAKREEEVWKQQTRLEARPGFHDGQALYEALDVAENLRREQDGQLARWEAQDQGVTAFSTAEEEQLKQQELLRQKVQKRFADNDSLQNTLNAQRGKRQALDQERALLEEAIDKEVKERHGVLDELKKQLREAEVAERETHDRVNALELQMRDEGFDTGQKRSKVNKRYAKPYQDRLRLDATYLKMLREEVRLLTKLEGAESEQVKEKKRTIASYTTERLTELSRLPEPALIDESQAGKLREYRTVLGIESAGADASEETVDVVEPQDDAQDLLDNGYSEVLLSARDDTSEDAIFHLEVEKLPELELSQISEEGQKLYQDFQTREEALKEAQAKTDPALEKLRNAEKIYHYSQALDEIAQSQVLEVQSPSQLELVGYPALAVVSSILTILSIAWMLRFDYLYLLLVVLFIALAAYSIYNVLGLVERRRLAGDAQAKRSEAGRYRKELEAAEEALKDAREELQELEASVETLDRQLAQSRSDWELRETEERRIHGKLRLLRQRMNFERDTMAQLDRELPELAKNYEASEAMFQEEQRKQDSKRKEAQEAQDSAKALVEQREAAVQAFLAEQAQLNESEEAKARRARVDALRSEIESLEEAEKEQLEVQGIEREALKQELREAGYENASVLDDAYEALSQKKQRLEAEVRSAAEARKQLVESFKPLAPQWEGFLRQLKTLELIPEIELETRIRRALEPMDNEPADVWISRLRTLSDDLDVCHEMLEQLLRDYERLKETRKELSAGKASAETLTQWHKERERLEAELAQALAELEDVTQVKLDLGPCRDDDRGPVLPAVWDRLTEHLQARAAMARPSKETLEMKERQLLQEVSSLRMSLEKDEEKLPSLEALARDLYATEEEIRYRKLQLAAIKLAQEGMKDAYQEMREYFSPQLQSYASDYLGKLTRGRYNRLMVKHEKGEMMLSVLDEELGRAIEGEYLSGGTYDQIYLALRLGMIKLLDPDMRLPLFLDDLLLQFDGERTRAALEVLDELVREGRQILYFTCSEALPPLIKEICPSWEVRPLLEA